MGGVRAILSTEIDWIRDDDDGPKEMRNGMLVLTKCSGACFAVPPEDLPEVRELIDEAIRWYEFEDESTRRTDEMSIRTIVEFNNDRLYDLFNHGYINRDFLHLLLKTYPEDQAPYVPGVEVKECVHHTTEYRIEY